MLFNFRAAYLLLEESKTPSPRPGMFRFLWALMGLCTVVTAVRQAWDLSKEIAEAADN